ncbi:PQQ-binding-like beta-propeller repeat protein [Streptomyces sp. NPDC088554]|uniref:protein kinase domain-containing protein n=1 Tax=Streptomyces sp. NPDC088554 TaxID=3365865 RepID=UPI003824E6C2
MPPLRNTGPAPEAERPDYAGRYLLESALGSGGMGVVHLATSASGLRLAIKVIHTNHASDPEFRARFRQEVAAARRVSGAFTAPVVDADPEAVRPWMATLFIDGPTLSERVKRSGPLGPTELIMLGAGLAEGLRDIHRAGVVHRDLKPSNVLLAPDGPKVIDFGISRPVDSDLRTETGKLIGTPPFMAPEQFQRPREVGPAADVFAMGAVLVHAATGRGPFDSDSPYIVAYQVVHNEPDLAGVPEELLPLVIRCLAKDPAERPTPDEVMASLRVGVQEASGVWGTREIRGTPGAPGVPGAPGTSPLVPSQRRSTATGTEPARLAPDTTHSPASRLRTRLPGAVRSPALGGRRRGRWVAAGAAVAVLGAAGVVGVRAMGDDSAPISRPVEPAVRGFVPWQTTLGGDGMPVCSAGSGGAGVSGVYCAGPGVRAARLDPVTGRVGWRIGAGRTEAGTDGGAPPVLSGGLLHVVAPGGGRLEALDPGSGARRWGTDVSSYAAVRHTADSVLLVSYDGRVRSLDAATGTERWSGRRGGTGTVWTAASGAAGPLFGATPSDDGTATEVSALDPATGAPLWKERLAGGLTPVGATGRALFLLGTDPDQLTRSVVRIDARSRAVRRVPLDAPVDQAQATVDGDTVHVVGYSGSLLAVATGGRPGIRWRLETSVTRASRPAVAGGHVYLSAGDGRLLAVDGRRGVLLGQTRPRMSAEPGTLAPALAAPVAVSGRVFASAPDGTVFAVDGRDPEGW